MLERNDPVAAFYDTVVKNKAVRVVTVPVVLGTPNNARLMHIQVAETLHKRKTLAREVLTLITLPQLLIIALAASIIWYAVSRSLRPLIELEASVAARSPLELKPMEMTGVPTETRPLINAINGLLDRVNQWARLCGHAGHFHRFELER